MMNNSTKENEMFDVDSLRGYCKKYRIKSTMVAKIVREFNEQKPQLVTNSQYFKDTFGYVFSVDGKTVTIEMWNLLHHHKNNVTFVGFEGINI